MGNRPNFDFWLTRAFKATIIVERLLSIWRHFDQLMR